MTSKPRIAITVGDPAGIGPEIVAQAVLDRRVLSVCEPIVIGDPMAFALHHQPLPEVEMLSIPGLNKKLVLGESSREAGESALEALRKGLALVLGNQAQALVTAPVSKESFHEADVPFPGHTEWLAAECKAGPVAMLMVAGRLRALLVTRHVPLAKAPHTLTKTAFIDAALLADRFIRELLHKRTPRIVACGINPHAGDNGLIGHEEKKVLLPAIAVLLRRGISVQGPSGADSVFRDMVQGRYDLALAAYHDQGMIPLKVFAPEKLVNITLGLPFIRTSPGHGTAYDIAGKGRASPGPMIEAIRLAAQYCQ